MLDVVRRTAEQVFIPLTVGGGVRSVDDVDALLRAGRGQGRGQHRRHRAARAAGRGRRRFGSQCIVLSVDARTVPAGEPPTPSGWEVTTHGGRRGTGIDAVEWAARGQSSASGRSCSTRWTPTAPRPDSTCAMLARRARGRRRAGDRVAAGRAGGGFRARGRCRRRRRAGRQRVPLRALPDRPRSRPACGRRRDGGPVSASIRPIAARLKRDADGLVCAVAQQRGTGEVLMVAWMDDEALHRTLDTGERHVLVALPRRVLGQGRDLRATPAGARGAAGLRRRHRAADGRPDRARVPHRRPHAASTPTCCSPSVPDPLAETAARLRALVPAFPDTYDVVLGEVSGPGWVRLDAAPVARWCAEARERGNPRRLASVAAAAVGGALAHAVLARVTAALALDGRAWDLGADALTVHRAPEGHLDRVAVRPPAWVVAGDPAVPAAPQARHRAPECAAGRAGAHCRAVAGARCGAPRVGVAGRARRTVARGAGRVCSPTRPRCSTRSPPRPSRRWPRCWTRCAPPPGSGWCRCGTRRVTPCGSPPRWRRATRGVPRGRAWPPPCSTRSSPTAPRSAAAATDQPLPGRAGAGARAGRLLPRLPHRPAGRRPLRRPVHHLPPARPPRSAPAVTRRGSCGSAPAGR